MRLCAPALPADIRVTRRRSVLPSPPTAIPKEDNSNGRSEDNARNEHDLLWTGLTRVVPYQLRAPVPEWARGALPVLAAQRAARRSSGRVGQGLSCRWSSRGSAGS